MQNRKYFLFVVFLLIIVQVTSINLFNRKDRKNNDNYYDDDDYLALNAGSKHNRLNNDYPLQSLTNRRNRYPTHGSSLPNNYRTRSRWPSSFDERYDLNEWSPYGHGQNNLLSKFPGPLPSPGFDHDIYLNNGPTCYSLLDPQYALFSDICGAVPQARYSLPNSFGHVERWQIAQTLSAILGPSGSISANPQCTRSLRLLLCPLLFPPCPTRYEAPPVLPCQPFCRVVKNQCASPSLELLPCDLLPPTSDLCPINPTPYSSLLSSYGPQLPLNGGLPQSGLQSLLAQSALQSGLSPSDLFSTLSSSPYPLGQTPLGLPTSPYQSAQTPLGAPTSPMQSLLSSLTSLASADPYNMADSLTPILVDFPPIQYGQPSQYFPSTHSAPEHF